MLHRRERLNELIGHELGMMFARDFDFDGALVTITNVEVSDDLLQAVVTLAMIPPERGPDIYQEISNAERRLRGTLLRKLKMRVFPKLIFKIDETSALPIPQAL